MRNDEKCWFCLFVVSFVVVVVRKKRKVRVRLYKEG